MDCLLPARVQIGSWRKRSVFCSCYIAGYILRFLRKTRTMKHPLTTAISFLHGTTWASIQTLSFRDCSFPLFFSPEIKTIVPQKHKFCSAVTEPAFAALSGKHWMGHCLLFLVGKKIESNKETLFICCFSAVKNNNWCPPWISLSAFSEAFILYAHEGKWGIWERNHIQWNKILSSQLETRSWGVLKPEAVVPGLAQVRGELVIKETCHTQTAHVSFSTRPWSESLGSVRLLFSCLSLLITCSLSVSECFLLVSYFFEPRSHSYLDCGDFWIVLGLQNWKVCVLPH